MGQYAEDIIDGTCNWQGDYTYKYNTKGYKERDTPAEKKINKVRRELRNLIKKFESQGIPEPLNNARKYINLKYGKGWRERGLVVNDEDQWKSLSEYPEPKDFKINIR